jgi:thiamine biosynthesis protein ThiS
LIEVTINGDSRSIPGGKTILELLELLAMPADRVAVELNRSIVRKPDWNSTVIDAGARIEIVQFVGGGRL